MMRLGLLSRKRHRKLLERRRLARHKARVGPELYAMDRINHALALKKRLKSATLKESWPESLLPSEAESSPPTELILPKSFPPKSTITSRLKRLNPFSSTTKQNDSL